MSVLANERNVSNLEFLETARAICVLCIKCCENMPKRHYNYIQAPFMHLISNSFIKVKMGNSIYPNNQHELQLRRDYFFEAYAGFQAAISYLGIIQDMSLLSNNQIQEISSKISKELSLIKGVMTKDKERFCFDK